MANMNGNDTNASQSPDMVICESLKVIKNDKKTADSMYTANETLQTSKETVKGYKICCLDKAEESNGVYQDILTCVTIENFKKAEIIQKNTEEYIKKDDEIEKLIKESSKLLNQMRVKMEDAHNAACAMSNCVKNKILPKSKGHSKDDKVAEIDLALKDIMDKTKKLDEKGQNTFESAVTIAGIQTFTNTSSLKEFTTLLMDSMKVFKSCVEANIKSTDTEVITSRAELNVIVEELAQIGCDKMAQSTSSQGLDLVMEYVCIKDNCEDECLNLCRETKNCYDKEGRSNDKRKWPKNEQSEDKN